tara:strand:- start:1938 stop:2222 length:285 start_codon:yes stop_codon:yes gene_type:complete
MSGGTLGRMVTFVQPRPDEAALKAAQMPLNLETDETLRRARLLARVLLNQGDGTFVETNAVADDFARLLVAEVRKVEAEQKPAAVEIDAEPDFS